jgi:hypothetical protein
MCLFGETIAVGLPSQTQVEIPLYASFLFVNIGLGFGMAALGGVSIV